MKKSAKVSLCGMSAALSIVIMFFTGIVPIATIALPAIAGVLLIPTTAECGTKYGFTAFAAVSVLGFAVVPDREAWLFYLLFFGYYPVLYGLLDRVKNKKLLVFIKMLIFAFSFSLETLLSIYVLGIPFEALGPLGKWSFLVIFVLGEITFLVYDKCIHNLIVLYFIKVRGKVRKLFKM